MLGLGQGLPRDSSCWTPHFPELLLLSWLAQSQHHHQLVSLSVTSVPQVWMCGGEIEIVPCSRVGHIFRNDNPYSFPKDRVRTVERNLARVAEVWLDEYRELFYGHAYHLLLSGVDVGDLAQQVQLRKRLQCKTFRWYLENVYPDLEAPLVKASGLVGTQGLHCSQGVPVPWAASPTLLLLLLNTCLACGSILDS